MENAPGRPYNVLVVDDEEDVPPMFQQRLRRDVRRGRYALHFAASGVEALSVLEEQPDIDLVVTDINMPEMDGLKLLEHIAESDLNLRSVVLSAYGNMKNVRAAMNLGAFDFVMKPVDFDDMRATMERCLRNLELWREASATRDEYVSLNRDLEIAWDIQDSALPRAFPVHDGYSVHAALEPARMVSGDFYDLIPLGDERIGLVVADVCGKGIPAAMVMMSTRTLLRGLAIAGADPGQVLREVNNVLAADNPLCTFVTMIFGVFDPRDGSFTYANAGHDFPVVFGLGEKSFLHEGGRGISLGLVPGMEYPVCRIVLRPGQGLFVCTDGVTEAQNAAGDLFGIEGVHELLSGMSCDGGDADAVTRVVVDAVHEFAAGHQQSDDITCLAQIFRNGSSGLQK